MLEGLRSLSHTLHARGLTPPASGVTGLVRFVLGAKAPVNEPMLWWFTIFLRDPLRTVFPRE